MFRIVFVLFFVLILFYWFFKTRSEKIVPLWKSIPVHTLSTEYQPCKTDEDCGTESLACFDQKCLPKLRGSGECDPRTGKWTLIQKDNRTWITCVCTYPHLITQKYEGGNCDTDIACGIHGRLNFDLKTCSCDDGYTPTDPLGCRKMTPHEMGRDGNKSPCSFDALSGRPLRFTRFEPNVGCLCDPRYGNFGVKIEHYLKDIPGYNACASLLRREQPLRNVKLYAYFYMFDKMPAAFIQFSNVDPALLAPEFKRSTTWQIEETWPYDYMQYILGRKEFHARARSCYYWRGLVNRFECDDYDFRPVDEYIRCSAVPENFEFVRDDHQEKYSVLMRSPTCQLDENDSRVHPVYRGRTVLNPFHLHWDKKPERWRTNGLEMRLGEDGTTWLLDVTPPFRIDEFMSGDLKFVPRVTYRI